MTNDSDSSLTNVNEHLHYTDASYSSLNFIGWELGCWVLKDFSTPGKLLGFSIPEWNPMQPCVNGVFLPESYSHVKKKKIFLVISHNLSCLL